MSSPTYEVFRTELTRKKSELSERLERISKNLRRGYEADSKERAKQLEDNEVVDALGNEAREEISKITAALQRIDSGAFGFCVECGQPIEEGRIKAYPYADECIDCAEFDEHRRARQ